MDRKKILFHLHRPPIPVNAGDARRMLGILNYFKQRQYFFSLDAVSGNGFANLIWNAEAKEAVLNFVDRFFVYEGERNFWDFCYSRSQSLYYQKLRQEQLPIDSDYFSPPGYIKFVASLMSQEDYDIIWINYIQFAHLAVRRKFPNTQTLIDIHDLGCQGRLVTRNQPHLKGLKFDYEMNLKREVNLLNKFDGVIVNSDREMVVLKAYISPDKLWWIPHSVEESIDNNVVSPYIFRKFKYDLLFLGSDRIPNAEGINFFLTTIFPTIVEKIPDIKLAIAGTVAEVVQVAPSLEKNIDSIGYLPDLSNIYLSSRIVICPLLDGAGTKVKLQEAMAYAIPIVTTTVGASGMNLKDGINAFITDISDLFADQIIRILEEPEVAKRISQELANTFVSDYSNSAVYSKLDLMFGISPSGV